MMGQVINQLHIRDNGSMRPAVCEYTCQRVTLICIHTFVDVHRIVCAHILDDSDMQPVVCAYTLNNTCNEYASTHV